MVINLVVYQFIRIGTFLQSRKKNNTIIPEFFVKLSIFILDVFGMQVYN